MSAQGLLSSVFSCSLSPKTITKQKLRQTRSLDPALMRHYGTGAEKTLSMGDFTWKSVSGRSIGLKPVPLQSLSELERCRLQDVAFRRLLRDRDMGCHISIPKNGHKHKKSLRQKLDSLSKEKSKDKEVTPLVFGVPLCQVISNDRTLKQRHDPPWEGHSDPTELMLSFLHLTTSFKRTNREFSSSNSSLSSSEAPNESTLISTADAAPRTRRRGGVSVDCITDLDDNQSRLLEALHLSLPAEKACSRKKRCDKKLSLNPIYRQVPRVVELCCQHLEKHGLQTVGIFRVGSSRKRVRQLCKEFDRGWEVHLDEEHSVHDVAALLKEFLRDMPEPLLTRELYTAFINTVSLARADQEHALQLLIFLLPPCNSDTLQRLLHMLSTVAAHADDSVNCKGQKVSGNKMTSYNLATIFGPNLLHKQKNPEKEFTVQSFARAEESTAVISVVQKMISTQQTLFMVPADLQNEVLMSLLESDGDVVDYLLRRKASQNLGPGTFSLNIPLNERRLSSNSTKVSSGDVSPYDNNSPVLSDGLMEKYPDDSDPFAHSVPRLSFTVHSPEGSSRNSPTLSTDKEASADHFWDTWEEFLSEDFADPRLPDVTESQSCRSSEEWSGRQGNNKPPITPTATSLGVLDNRPHLPVTRSSSGPHDHRGQTRTPSPLHQRLCGQSGAISLDNLAAMTRHPACPLLEVRTHVLSHNDGALRETHITHSTPSLPTRQPNLDTLKTAGTAAASGSEQVNGAGAPDWRSGRWHIWQKMSEESPEKMPETLV